MSYPSHRLRAVIRAIALLTLALSTIPWAHAANCPTADIASTRYAIDVPSLTGTALNAFNTLRDDGVAQITAYHGASPVTAGVAAAPPGSQVGTYISPGTVADYLGRIAAQELEAYAVDELVKAWCGQPTRAAYFPNTCGSQVTSKSAQSADLSTKINTLRTTLRLDIEALPACAIFQRSPSNSVYGYLLTSLIEQLVSNKDHDYAALLHGIATNDIIARECDGYPAFNTAGCQLYLVSVAIDAALVTRSAQKASQASFTFATIFSAPNDATVQRIAQQLSGSFLADLAIARCGGGSAQPVPTTICTSDGLVTFWMQLFGYYQNVGAAALVTTIRDFASDVDQVEQLEATIKAITKLEKGLSAADQAKSASATDTGSALSNTNKAQLQLLQVQVVTSTASLITTVLPEFGKLSIAPPPNIANRAKQIEQVADVLTHASKAYGDFQSKDYLDGVQELVAMGAAACENQNTAPATSLDLNVCGFLFSNKRNDFPPVEVIAFAAQLSTAKDETDFASMIASQNGGANAWKAKQTTRMWWLGSYVGLQGGWEHLSGPGYSDSGADYGAFAPVGIGFSWPKGFFGWRPLSLYASAFDVGSLVSTSTAFSSSKGNVSSKSQTGWAQLLAPGAYVATPLLGPVYVGVGYAYRTPALRSVTLPNGTQINADSNRIEAFVAVDVTLFYRKQ